MFEVFLNETEYWWVENVAGGANATEWKLMGEHNFFFFFSAELNTRLKRVSGTNIGLLGFVNFGSYWSRCSRK